MSDEELDESVWMVRGQYVVVVNEDEDEEERW